MSAADLVAAGLRLYGPRWKAELARRMGVAGSTVTRWARGEVPISARVAGHLKMLANEAGQK